MFNKTHIYIFFSFLLFSIKGIAQTHENTDAELTLDHFEGKAVIQFEDNQTIKFQKGSQPPFKAEILLRNGVSRLKNESDTTKIKETLGLTTIAIPAINIDNKIKDLNAIEQLMNIAHQRKNHKLILVGSNNRTDYSNTTTPEQEELITAPAQNKPDTENPLLLPMLFAGGGILLGFLFGWLAKKPQQITNTIEKEVFVDRIVQKETSSKKTSTAKKSADNSDELAKLQQQLTVGKATIKELKQQATLLTKQIEQLQQFDAQYYEQAFQEIVLPMQKAINIGDLSQIFKYIILASIQLQSIARYKTNKKLKYDEQNIALLLRTPFDAGDYPVLTKDTPADQTPKNLQQTMSVFKQLGIKDLDAFIFQGYTIKQLND